LQSRWSDNKQLTHTVQLADGTPLPEAVGLFNFKIMYGEKIQEKGYEVEPLALGSFILYAVIGSPFIELLN
jgi:hypothetical protein